MSVENRLFETLDPTTRGFEHDGRRYLVTDTVGFIRRLPHQLVEGFAATLEETLVADLVLHVADASARDDQLDAMVAAVEEVLRRDRRRRAAGPARAEQDRPRRRDRPPPAREPLPRRAAGLGRDRRGPRGAEGADRRAVRRAASRRSRLLLPYEEGGRLSELYALGAPIESREDTPDGVLVVARLPRHELRRYAPFLIADAAQRETRLIELPIRRLRDEAVLPARAYSGDAGLDLSAVRARRARRRASARSSRRASRSRSRRATRASCSRVRASRAKHGISIVNTPGLVDSGYRGELLINLLNTDPRETFVVEPGMRIAQLVVLRIPEVELVVVDELPDSERGVRGFGSSTALMRTPRVRVAALIRWQERVLLCRQEKPGKEYWLLPGGGVDGGETLDEALRRELGEELGLWDDARLRGADRRRRVDRAGLAPGRPARRPHRLRRRSLRPLARGLRDARRRRSAACGSSRSTTSRTSCSTRR